MNGVLDDRFKATVAWAPLVDPIKSNVKFSPEVLNYVPVNLLRAKMREKGL